MRQVHLCMRLHRADNGVLAEWSPSGRLLLVATTAPRLRVDNGFTLYRYDGSVAARQPFEVLRPLRVSFFVSIDDGSGRVDVGVSGGSQ